MADESKAPLYEDPHCDDEDEEMDRRISQVAFVAYQQAKMKGFAFVAKLRNSQPSANVRRSGSPISPRISNGIPIIITSKSSAHISSPYLVIST